MNINPLLRTFALTLSLVAAAGCSTLQTNVVKEPSHALPPATDTPSAQYVESEQNKHQDNESGFRLLTLSTNALMSRVTLADHAEHSIDLQYYIFRNDATGRLIAQHLLKAADRGVRVRILLDDAFVTNDVPMFDALDAHQNIEVRLFNPFNTKDPSTISKLAQMLFDGRRLNRRMHNKSFIADNKVAIIGGRNIGDDYFNADKDNNYRDLDLLAIGPVVQEASRTFDSYWNDAAAYPVTAFPSKRDTHFDLVQLRAELSKDARVFAESDYAQAVLDDLPDGATADRKGQWFWGPAVEIADQPEKVAQDSDAAPRLSIGPRLKAIVDGAKSEVLMTSPYFVPGKDDEQDLIALAQRGVSVKILTNSLASTDEPAAHEGYSEHRQALLAGGVHLYELKPTAGTKLSATEVGTSSGVSLHAKSFVVDRRYVFVGSMNMDQRSKLLNTEMGLVVDSPALANAVGQFFATATDPANSYQVLLGPQNGGGAGSGGSPASGGMHWQTTENGKTVDYDDEPAASLGKRMKVWLLKLLPIDSLL
jgi:putative cardiolipin synthase